MCLYNYLDMLELFLRVNAAITEKVAQTLSCGQQLNDTCTYRAHAFIHVHSCAISELSAAASLYLSAHLIWPS